MRTLYDLKPRFQMLLRPLTGILFRAGVTANAITLTAVALSTAYGVFLAITQSKMGFILIGPVLLLRMGLNAMDGMLAREHHQISLFGARLNEMSDVISDIALYLPFAVIVTPAWPVFFVVALGVLAEFAGVISLAYGGERNYDGPFGKSDRAAFFALIGLTAGILPAPVVTILFAGAAAASAITIFNRLLTGARSCKT
jgi:phosphatidylglycerophosphate synthase